MSIKGVKLKSESFFSIFSGVLELRRKNLRGADSAPPPPPGPDRVKNKKIKLLTLIASLKQLITSMLAVIHQETLVFNRSQIATLLIQ